MSQGLGEPAIRLFISEYLTQFGLLNKKHLSITDSDKFSKENRCHEVNPETGLCVRQFCDQHASRTFCCRAICDQHPIASQSSDTTRSVGKLDMTHFRTFMQGKEAGEQDLQLTSPALGLLFRVVGDRNPGLESLTSDAPHAGKGVRNLFFFMHETIRRFKCRSLDPETWALAHWPQNSILDPITGRMHPSFTGFPVLTDFVVGAIHDTDAQRLLSCSPRIQVMYISASPRPGSGVGTLSGVDPRLRFRRDFLIGPRVNVIAEESSSLSQFLVKHQQDAYDPNHSPLGDVHWLSFCAASMARPWDGTRDLCRSVPYADRESSTRNSRVTVIKKHMTLTNLMEEAVKERTTSDPVVWHDILSIGGEDGNEFKILDNVFCANLKFQSLRVVELWNTRLSYLPQAQELTHLQQLRVHVMDGTFMPNVLRLQDIQEFAVNRFTHGLHLLFFRYEGPLVVTPEALTSFNQSFARTQQIKRQAVSADKWVTLDTDFYHHFDHSYDREVSQVKRLDGIRFQTFSPNFPLIPEYVVSDSRYLTGYFSKPENQAKYHSLALAFPAQHGPQSICCHTFRQGSHSQHKTHDLVFYYGLKDKNFGFAGREARQQFDREIQMLDFAVKRDNRLISPAIKRTDSQNVTGSGGLHPRPPTRSASQTRPPQQQVEIRSVSPSRTGSVPGIKRSPSATRDPQKKGH